MIHHRKQVHKYLTRQNREQISTRQRQPGREHTDLPTSYSTELSPPTQGSDQNRNFLQLQFVLEWHWGNELAANFIMSKDASKHQAGFKSLHEINTIKRLC